ncbi:ribosomal protein S1 (mitochondrion) [Marchantia polymorpha subsp. ruderalis]|uniref:Ribosomal protein S1 n=2 Tax=Marchantia polymorpha TaxID=3197 RepID=A0A2Z6DTD8_MARPO|nr:ribosomal protein S1 [Marchantia polymorpha subsp. ruderalis]QBE89512.1 ribosomal protein S1 [Marchantia polymorpha subsp. ruderalis]BBD75164.1 ribosomal protein S1 [Marchantia polymorpha subsp. ruderalis]BDD77347.1 ribosomal protein S1 [Marchantia polymorpha subsp. ruderalis]
MSFSQLFPKYNSSFNPLRGSAIQCSVIQLQQNKVLVDTGLKTPIICFQHELKRVPITKQARFHFGIEDVEVFGEPKMLLPKPLEIKCKRKLVWIELTKIWRSDQNLVKGFILNSVKGGYAVAIAGYIAFLPKSLLRSRKVFYSQWRIFSILNMKPKISNIVVKEIGDGKIDYFSPTKSHQKQTKYLGAKLKHWRNMKKNTNVKKKYIFSEKVPTTKKTKQGFKHLGPKPLAYTEKKRETTKQSTKNNVFQLKDQGRGK